MTTNDNPSRHINLWRKATGSTAPKVYDRLNEIQTEVEACESLLRPRKAVVREGFAKCMYAICLDLFHAHGVDPSMITGVHRDNNRLTGNAAYPAFVTARTFRPALDGLQATGYVEEVSRGTEGSGKSTRVQATPLLIRKMAVVGFSKPDIADNSKGIRLALASSKSKRKVPTAYSETADTRHWQANLDTINKEIHHHIVGLDRTSAQREEIELQRRATSRAKGKFEKKPYNYQRLDMDAVEVHRVFNSRDWRDGGRYYGGWWQNVPKEYRKFLTIDGKDTCEYDYSSIHPRLLYAKSGYIWPVDKDPYSAPHGLELRDTVKKAFLIMLNKKGAIQEKQVPHFDSATAGMSWEKFVEGIAKTHAPINKFLGTGIGVRLQRIDADIAEAVMLKFANMRYACLPVHDSFITLASLGDELKGIMKHIVREMHGIDIEVEAKPAQTYSGPTDNVDTDISDLLEPTDQVDQRHIAWIKRRDQQDN